MDRALPEGFVAQARRFYEEGRLPVHPKRAATVVLLRDTGDGMQAYLIRRKASMAFASGMYAFPGGAVDPRDLSHQVGWVGPDPAWWAERLGLEDESAARGMVCAAVRETFEESGVLLAGPESSGSPADSVVGDVSGPEWETARQALVDRELAFSDFLDGRGLVLRSDLLAAWSRWITPEFEPRRYDTCFFLAVLPAAQRTRDVGGEADRVEWLAPAAAVMRFHRGEIAMFPPTVVTLTELAEYDSAAAAAAAAGERDLTPVQPKIVFDDDGARIVT